MTYTVALLDWDPPGVVAVTVYVPALFGGVYKPVGVIVPRAADPPTTPFTDQVRPLPLAVNCSVCVEVNATTCGPTANAA